MQYRAGHEDEVALHHELRDAFNRDLTNRNFFVWLNVDPTGEAKQFAHLDKMVERTEAWLANLNPDAVREGDLPTLQLHEEAASVEITALPRRREVRDHRAQEIVGNPGPVLVGWG
ncbi:MAG TPA: hypothetical protein VMT37_14575 [Solirubrobacterales bacterium]|nr:hypothetical protein [Solirubrobacterales bacterium]